jgi:hypothetical protein
VHSSHEPQPCTQDIKKLIPLQARYATAIREASLPLQVVPAIQQCTELEFHALAHNGVSNTLLGSHVWTFIKGATSTIDLMCTVSFPNKFPQRRAKQAKTWSFTPVWVTTLPLHRRQNVVGDDKDRVYIQSHSIGTAAAPHGGQGSCRIEWVSLRGTCGRNFKPYERTWV